MSETIWIIIALFGMVFTYLALDRAKRDKAATDRFSNGRATVRKVITSGALFRNRVRMVLFSWWALIGIIALAGDVIPGINTFPAEQRVAGLLGLIGTAMGHVFLVFHENHEDNTLDELLTRLDRGDLRETRNEREDREFGEQRRALEVEHVKAGETLDQREDRLIGDNRRERQKTKRQQRTEDERHARQHRNEGDPR